MLVFILSFGYSMVFVACGLNHKTAPLEIREKIALPVAMQETLLHNLVDLTAVNEAAILSTCNRTEIYCDTDNPTDVVRWLANEHQVSPQTIEPYFYIHQGHQAVRHTLRVASGLDSMMIGEPQILGQMKQAYQQGCRVGTVKHNLSPVFQYIFRASKRIRNQSGIGNSPISIAFAAVQLIGQCLSNYKDLTVFLIGSGETAALVAKYLRQQGVNKFMVASRTLENAKRLAVSFDGLALSIQDIPHYLPQADVIISATACPLPFISKNMVQDCLDERENRPMFLLDLAVPRDIEPDVNHLEHVHLYNIDDLQHLIEQGMNERRAAAQHAEQLIDVELEKYVRWRQSLRAKHMICDYRSNMQQLAQKELQRAIQKLSTGQCQYKTLDELSTRLVNKLMHMPSVGLRQAAADNREELLDLAQSLFSVAHEKIT